VLTLGLLAVTLTACGHDGNALPSDAAALMRAQIANARAAAAEGQYTDAISNVREVERVVADLRARHDIAPARADEIEAAAAALGAALQRYVAPTTTTTTTTTVPTTAPPAPKPDAGPGHERPPKHHGPGPKGD
jgi:HAMP domain-containing protein